MNQAGLLPDSSLADVGRWYAATVPWPFFRSDAMGARQGFDLRPRAAGVLTEREAEVKVVDGLAGGGLKRQFADRAKPDKFWGFVHGSSMMVRPFVMQVQYQGATKVGKPTLQIGERQANVRFQA